MQLTPTLPHIQEKSTRWFRQPLAQCPSPPLLRQASWFKLGGPLLGNLVTAGWFSVVSKARLFAAWAGVFGLVKTLFFSGLFLWALFSG